MADEIESGYHVNLGSISKRVNSTKRIEHGQFSLRVPVYFKTPCSMENPVIYIRYNSLDTSPNWNYAQIEETNSYYWITDIVSLKANCWQISMVMDPLATFKDDIKATRCFVEYGFNLDASGAIFRLQDTRQNVGNVPLISTKEWEVAESLIDDTGIFILSAVGKSGLTTYALTAAQMETLLTAVNISWKAECAAFVRWELALPEFMNKLLFGSSAVECIRNCFWAPIAEAAPITAGSQEITLGDFSTGVTARVISPQRKVYRTTKQEIPWPALDWKRLNCQIQIFVPFIGTVVVPVDKCNNAKEIIVDFAVTAVDGNVTVRVSADDFVLYVGSTSIAASYAVGASNVDPLRAAGAIVTTVGGAIAVGGAALAAAPVAGAAITAGGASLGSAIGAGIASQSQAFAQGGLALGHGVGSTMQAIQPLNMCAGTMQGASQCALGTKAKLVLLYYPPIDDLVFQSVYGHPVMRVTKPADGYCKTRGFSLASDAALASELSYINQAMDSGVFIE